MSSSMASQGAIVYGESLRDRLHGLLRNTPWWMISLVVHTAVLVFAYCYTWEVTLPGGDTTFRPRLVKRPDPPRIMIVNPTHTRRQQETSRLRRTEMKKHRISHTRLPELPDIVARRDRDADHVYHHAPDSVTRMDPSDEGRSYQRPEDLPTAIRDLIIAGDWGDRSLAVWLFDESRSMKDDQQLVRQTVEEFYEGIGVEGRDVRGRMRVVTAVCSYGKDFHVLLGKPTTDVERVRRVIARVPVDDSGKENVLAGVNGVLNELSRYARKYGRNIIIILVTDEAGDDDTHWQEGQNAPLERTLTRMKKLGATLFVFGKEAGAFAYGVESTFDPTVGDDYNPYGWVNRGIDTAFGEMIPHDWHGFRNTARVPSGFGPYGLMRLCKETGGVYFILRGTRSKPYDYEKLGEGYPPELVSRVEIARRNRDNSLRRVVMGIIEQWKSIRDKEDGRFRTTFPDTDRGRRQMATTMEVVDEWLQLMNEGIKRMSGLANVSFGHAANRWEANRDLMWAQLHKTRFQLTQYKLALTELMHNQDVPMARRTIPPPGDGGWHISYAYGVALRGDGETVARERKNIQALFQAVVDRHAGTPWDVYARTEMRGMRGYEVTAYSPGPGGGKPSQPQ